MTKYFIFLHEISWWSLLISRVVYRGYNNANANGGVSNANANNDATNANANVGSRLANKNIGVQHRGRVPIVVPREANRNINRC
jgi:hypothetical protein